MSAPRDLQAQLAGLQAELERRRREAAERQAREQARARAERAQREQFRDAVGAVHALNPTPRHAPAPVPVEPTPRQRLADEAQVLAESISDDFDAATLLDTDAALGHRQPGVDAEVLARLRRGQWSIQRHLDLHGLTRDAARDAVAAFVRRAERDGLRCVRIVHGKGNGSPGRVPVLKAQVRRWLVQRNEVMAFAQAAAADGGHGAVLVLLRGRRA